MVKSKRLNPSSVETKRTKTNPRKERKAERGDGKWIGAASEQSIERKRRETRAVASAERGKLTESLI